MDGEKADQRASESITSAWIRIAGRLEVPRQTVNAIEAGRYEPSLGLALKMAKVFGKTVEELFTL